LLFAISLAASNCPHLPVPTVREPDYQILSRAHIVKEQQKDIDKVKPENRAHHRN
jgi:hypothetical protein